MAESRIKSLDLASLIAAKKNTGLADAINAASEGASDGINMAQSIQLKKAKQAKDQADIQARAQELKNKTLELQQKSREEAQNKVSIPQAPASTALVNNTPVPVASYDPNSNQVTPGYQPADKLVTPAVFNAMNPDPIKAYGRELNDQVAKGLLDRQAAANALTATKVPESFAPVAEKAATDTKPGSLLVKGSKSNDTTQVPVPAGFHTNQELANTRGEAMLSRNALNAGSEIRKTLDPNLATNPMVKLAAGKVAASERFETLLQQLREQNGGPTSRQTLETARQLDTLLSNGGQTSEAVTQALIPHTLLGHAKSFQEFVSNVPTGQGQQAFLEQTADTFHRERDTAKTMIHQYQKEAIAGLGEQRKIAPDTFNSQLLGLGLDPKNMQADGTYKDPELHDQALEWANANPEDPRAAAIKAKALQAKSQPGK